jgi:molecular chaperone HscB
MNYFEVFGLPRRLGVDAADLQRRFYELARRHHPDFHQGAAGEAEATEVSARVNAAYRTLRDPIRRLEYLIRLEEGRETKDGDVVKPTAPPELLEEMFEIQEALGEAQAEGLDAPRRATLAAQRESLTARLRAEEARLEGPLSAAWDGAAPSERARALAACKEALATRAYLRTVIDDLGDALGEGEGQAHVAHRRH